MTQLRDHSWRRRFSSSLDTLLEDFYKPALMDAVRYWRITGYFTSRSLLQILEGVEQLVTSSPDGQGHGEIRKVTVICPHHLCDTRPTTASIWHWPRCVRPYCSPRINAC